MGRKKVRNFPSEGFYKDMFKQYFNENNGAVIHHVITAIHEDPAYYGFNDLREDERNMRWGFDCGWIVLHPRDDKMRHEWELDNGKYNAYLWTDSVLPYCPQSTTLKKIMVRKSLADLGLEDTFYIQAILD